MFFFPNHRPHHQSSLRRLLKMHYRGSHAHPPGPSLLIDLANLIIIITYILLSLLTTGSNGEPSRHLFLPNTTIDGKIENLASDKDGNIFIATSESIYQYSSDDLKLLSKSSIKEATSTQASHASGPTQIRNKLLLYIDHTRPKLLLSCWQNASHHLKCSASQASNLAKMAPLETSSEDGKGLQIDNSISLKGLALNSTNFGHILVTSSKLPYLNTLSELQSSPHALSRMQIKTDKDRKVLQDYSVLPYRSSLDKADLYYEYIYLFSHDGYTYLVLNDMRKPSDNAESSEPSTIQRFGVKLARICNADPHLTSYIEIPVSCNEQVDLIAKAAHHTTRGTNSLIYIVFGLRNYESLQSNREQIRLCHYSLAVVQDRFRIAAAACHSGDIKYNLLSKMYDNSYRPCRRNSDEDWCTSRANSYIDGTASGPLIEEASLDLSFMAPINYLHATRQSEKDVIYVGTEAGQITKLLGEDPLFTLDVINNNVRTYAETNELKNFKNPLLFESDRKTTANYIQSSSSYLMVSAGDQLSQVELNTCKYYTGCRACRKTPEPLDCSWCSGGCKMKTSCETLITWCPPTIDSISPRSAPLNASTRLIITGENFASERGQLSVMLGTDECVVDRSKSGFDRIECTTKPVDSPRTVPLVVSAYDKSSDVDSNGTETMQDAFSFLPVKVYGITPGSWSLVKPNVTIYGQNLDAGSSGQVLIGNTTCQLISRNSLSILCHISSLDASHLATAAYPVKVFIDHSEQPWEFKSFYSNFELSSAYDFGRAPTESSVGLTDETPTRSWYSWLLVIIAFLVITSIAIYAKANMQKAKSSKYDEMNVSFTTNRSQRPSEVDSLNGKVIIRPRSELSNGGYLKSFDRVEPSEVSADEDQEYMESFDQKHIIDRSKLHLTHPLGSGQFGKVLKGYLMVGDTNEHIEVAVKTLHNRSDIFKDDLADYRNFLNEAAIMKDFHHDNVLPLIGITFDSGGPPMLITPIMKHGDLRTYIRTERSNLDIEDLVDFGLQVAKGMHYLAEMKYVHRDLAARNCMLDEKKVVKVADFGLSRDILDKDYYRMNNATEVPIKWMAIESLTENIYTTKTDVWSYGVVLWELMSWGADPYAGINGHYLINHLLHGNRLLQPEKCPNELYQIMLSCWRASSDERPTFDKLIELVSIYSDHN